jgi:hypothetical protein
MYLSIYLFRVGKLLKWAINRKGGRMVEGVQKVCKTILEMDKAAGRTILPLEGPGYAGNCEFSPFRGR